MRTMIKYQLLFFFTLFFFFSCNQKPGQKKNEDRPARQRIETLLREHLLEVWYPRAVDTINGGFYSDFSHQWEKAGLQHKFVVTQARHIWTLSFVYENYEPSEKYLEYASHGFRFLKDHMWDREFGGFHELVDSTGNVIEDKSNRGKRAYGNAFAIYALAQYYKVSENEEALNLAKDAFMWLEENSHDELYGGYFQVLHRDGRPVNMIDAEDFDDFALASIGIKDFNSTIHLLEAFTTLYQVWPDPLVKTRLQEMYDITGSYMLDERGFLKLYFYPDWTQVPDGDPQSTGMGPRNYVTFGHDVETAFLLFEAAEVLKADHLEVLNKMELLVDHALKHGWDAETGGFYDQGKYIDGEVKVINSHKEWWGQAEALNTLLLMGKLFPEKSQLYEEKFERQLDYIETYLIDHRFKGWYPSGIDENPEARTARKAQIWKGNYHTARALVSCLKEMK